MLVVQVNTVEEQGKIPSKRQRGECWNVHCCCFLRYCKVPTAEMLLDFPEITCLSIAAG